jgi:predicted nucleic acid-binding protein
VKETVAVDACVLMLILDTQTVDQKRLARQEKARFHFVKFESEGADFVIPAPVFSELVAGGQDGEIAAEALVRREQHIRVPAFDLDASRVAGRITALRLKNRGATPRALVKFDAMIAATAIASGATCILTADSDIAKCVASLPPQQQIRVIEIT